MAGNNVNNRFQQILNNALSAGLFKGKGAEVERFKKENHMQTQTGLEADTVEIDFGRLAGLEKQPGGDNSGVAKLVNDISHMTMEQARATLQNPDVFEKLVKAGILE